MRAAVIFATSVIAVAASKVKRLMICIAACWVIGVGKKVLVADFGRMYTWKDRS